jgi:capsid protein
MVQDPKQKARRLARALISDLVVYYPEKRQQGLRDGTLAQLFKEEIAKSWQEYVEQVGAELANSTPYWVDALNEILAGGESSFRLVPGELTRFLYLLLLTAPPSDDTVTLAERFREFDRRLTELRSFL